MAAEKVDEILDSVVDTETVRNADSGLETKHTLFYIGEDVIIRSY